MKMKFAAAALAVICALPASAATVAYNVDARASTGIATDFTLDAGQTFSVNVIDSTDTWILGASPREFTAAGVEVSGASYGTYTAMGSTFNFGTLVGQIGTGDFFAVGLGGTFTALTSGILSLRNWDSAYGDNADSIAVNVTAAVPVPAAGLMLLSALGLGGMAARKRRKTA